MSLSNFLQVFPHAKKAGDNQYTACCPAHDDKTPSLSISEGRDGMILLHCHAGCDIDDILSALGIGVRDLYPRVSASNYQSLLKPSSPRPAERGAAPDRPVSADIAAGLPQSSAPPAYYDYRDETGKLLYQVVRMTPKGFRQRRPTGFGQWQWSLGDVRRVIYRLPELAGVDTVIVTEGEKDADRLVGLGFAATTNSGGAKKWTDAHTAQLVAAGVKNVVIVPDNDEVGREHSSLVAASCNTAGLTVKVISLPDQALHGDVSDYLAAHERAEFVTLINETPIWSDSTQAMSIPDVTRASGTPVLTRLSDVEPEEIEWIWRGRLARGKFTQIAGNPGEGKSRLTLDIASRITTGAAWPDGSAAPVGNVLFVLAEDGISDTVRPAVDAMGGDSSRIYVLEGVNDESGVRSVNLARDLRSLEIAIEQLTPQLVVIDPITAFLGKTDSYKDAEVRGLLAPIIALIARHRTALITVAHLSKDTQKGALYRPGGSIAFIAAARFGFVVALHPEQPGVRVLARTKNNIGQPAASLAYRIQPPQGHITWVGESDLDADNLLAPPRRGRVAPQQEAASDCLLRLLEGGPLPSAEVYRLAAADGHAAATVRRAIIDIGIRPRKPSGSRHAKWLLALPDQDGDELTSLSPGLLSTPVQMSFRADSAPAPTAGSDVPDDASDGGDGWES
jgi:putative DNA primase/helicase